MARTTKAQAEPARTDVRKRIWLLGIGFLLVEILVFPGAASPFRVPKAVLALTVIIVVAGLSLAGALARGRVVLRWSPVATMLVALVCLQVVSCWWSSSPRLAVAAAVQTAIWTLGAVWIATATAGERRRLADLTAVGAAISGVVLILQAAGWSILTTQSDDGFGRLVLTGLTGNPADLAMAAVLLLPLVLAGGGNGDPTRFRWVLVALLTLAAVVSQTLTGFVGLGLAWATWLLQRRSRRIWISAAGAALVVLSVGLATGLDTRIHRQLWRLRHGDWYFLLSARGDGWTAAGEMIRSRPITGIGASNFTHAYYPSRVSWIERTGTIGHRSELATHFDLAHCDPLQMVAELGLPGLMWMVGFAWVLVRTRPRGDPILPLAAAAFVPFACLHFPTHLAVGLIPATLVLAHVLADADEAVVQPGRWARRLGAVVAVVAVLAGTYWQLQRLTLGLWRGGLRHALATADALSGADRAQRAAAVEAQILPRLPALGGAQPWMWRMVGRARLLRGDDVGAETAFRTAMSLWPHEEAEFGLGLALASQAQRIAVAGIDATNRRGEAILHLARVCRTNPTLLELIDDDDLRHSVTEIVQAAASATSAS